MYIQSRNYNLHTKQCYEDNAKFPIYKGVFYCFKRVSSNVTAWDTNKPLSFPVETVVV